MVDKEIADIPLERASFAGGNKQSKCLHEPSVARQHAVEAFHPHFTKEPHFCKMRQTVGIVRVGFVRGHVERCFGMTSIDADRRQTLCAQRMIEPHG